MKKKKDSTVIGQILEKIKRKRRYSGEVDKNGSPKDPFDPSIIEVEVSAPSKRKDFLQEHKDYIEKLKKEKRLNKKSKDFLAGLEDYFEKFSKLDGPTEEEIKEAMHGEHRSIILKAARLGFVDHPIVAELLQALHGLGNRKELRRAKLGLEKGAIRPMNDEEMSLFVAVADLEEKGYFWRSIHDNLKRKKIYNKSWQAFHKWLIKHDFIN